MYKSANNGSNGERSTIVDRTYTDRSQVATIASGGTTYSTRTYDEGQRLTQNSLGNGLSETRTYRMDNLVATINVPTVTDFSYQYDANKRKIASFDGVLSGQNQVFTYDDEDRLVDWTASSGARQDWDLSLVGDWDRTTGLKASGSGQGQGLTAFDETRGHNDVHEITSITNALQTPLTPQTVDHDPKGNLTANPQRGQGYAWDVDNRLMTAGNPADNLVADYRYDALGRRLVKTIRTGVAPSFATMPVLSYGSGQDKSGTATASLAGSGITLSGNSWKKVDIAPYTITAQTHLRVTFRAEVTGEIQGLGLDDNDQISSQQVFQLHGTQGWGTDVSSYAISPGGETLTNADPTAGWVTYDIPVGALNNGYLLNSTLDRLCLVNDDDGDASGISHFRHVVLYEATATGQETTEFAMSGPQVLSEYVNGGLDVSYVYGPYVDEPVVMVDHGDGDAVYYYHADHRYSVAAITDTTGNVAERYGYDAYGDSVVLDASGSPVAGNASAVGNPYRFQGRRWDRETELMQYRSRYYDANLGRFMNQNPWRMMGQGQIISNYAYMLIPKPLLSSFNTGFAGIGAYYFDNRLSLYDAFESNPGGFLEPFSDATAIANLQQEEGFRGDAYQDTELNWTVGYGFNLDRGGVDQQLADMGYTREGLVDGSQTMTQEHATQLLTAEATSAMNQSMGLVNNWGTLCIDAQRVLKEMVYQMGAAGVRGFKNMRAALQQDPPDYDTAADEMLDSRWAKQTPARAKGKAAEMRACSTGCSDPDHNVDGTKK